MVVENSRSSHCVALNLYGPFSCHFLCGVAMFANQDMMDEYFNQSLFYDFMVLMMPVFAASFFPDIFGI